MLVERQEVLAKEELYKMQMAWEFVVRGGWGGVGGRRRCSNKLLSLGLDPLARISSRPPSVAPPAPWMMLKEVQEMQS